MNKSKLAIVMLLGGILAACASTSSEGSKYNIDGFQTEIEDGRLWVFEEGSEDLAFFEEHGEPAKQYTSIGTGPNGMTVKASSQETLDKYLSTYKK